MKSHLDAILQRDQRSIWMPLLPPRDRLMSRDGGVFGSARGAQLGPEVALFLDLTVRAIGARRALEIGTAIGYGRLLAPSYARGWTRDDHRSKPRAVPVAASSSRRAGVSTR